MTDGHGAAAEPAPRKRRRVPWWVRLICYLLLFGLVIRWLEWRALYVPTREWDSRITLPESAEEVEFDSTDGVKLSGLWVPAREPWAVILYCHGNAGNLSHRIPVAERWSDLGISVLLFDYRGYGRSEGRPSESGLLRDARAALAEARRLGGEEPVVFGRSLGTVPAVRLAVEESVRGLVLDSPLASAADMAGELLPIPGLRYLIAAEFDHLAWISQVRYPLLVLHGEHDEMIPISQGRAVYAAAPEPKRFVVLRGSGHNNRPGDGGDSHLLEFLRELPAVR